ncbi:VanZ like family protein [Anaerovirgula multivorans]|uniref:VanZ like family protein n=1 Tax=Anaerovirgula multivorans TaxID=312168 RepID=A0A239LIU3_9FIRM|nr:VanZ family protein [Anaerovirgula multivorans]SNT30381.1 VanZ like family protein [Anaerovirgula multivorans]
MIKLRRLTVIFSWLAVLLWMVLIFYLSAQPAVQSNNLSKGITEVIVETVGRVAPNDSFDISRLNHLIRKNAHFFAYLVLGILVMNAMKRSGIDGFKRLILSLGICVLYAVSDEVHQLFVPGRSGQVKDVFIDSAGAVVGIVVSLGLSRIKKKVTVSR